VACYRVTFTVHYLRKGRPLNVDSQAVIALQFVPVHRLQSAAVNRLQFVPVHRLQSAAVNRLQFVPVHRLQSAAVNRLTICPGTPATKCRIKPTTICPGTPATKCPGSPFLYNSTVGCASSARKLLLQTAGTVFIRLSVGVVLSAQTERRQAREGR
jgi:hypothetical protein